MSKVKVPSVSQSVSESVTRSLIELFWTAKKLLEASKVWMIKMITLEWKCNHENHPNSTLVWLRNLWNEEGLPEGAAAQTWARRKVRVGAELNTQQKPSFLPTSMKE